MNTWVGLNIFSSVVHIKKHVYNVNFVYMHACMYKYVPLIGLITIFSALLSCYIP